ncbi:MAG: SPFH/Band 7/PHB domain protein, partial [Erysipelotrichaceae bacterium]|nr:SPFH/Band 7/PHB domain protein [Erysipelotrichaceae bacterium]
ITRVEVQNITPPRTIQEAMEKQMKAEREKREAILKAEGEKQSAITRAEGEKESAILRAEAVKEQRIREAEGEAKAVERMAQAKAEAIRLVNSAQPSSQYLSLRSLEAAEKMADGNATKIIVPSDLQNLAATVAAVTETIKK